jgi:hypothetical protein
LEVTDNDGDTDTVSITIVVKHAEEGGLGNLGESWPWILLIVIIMVMALIIAFLLLKRRPTSGEHSEDSSLEERPPIQ